MQKVSVTIPTIGREFYLIKTIKSLIAQTIPFDEILVFDNSLSQNLDILILKEFPNNNIKVIKSGHQEPALISWTKAVNACNNDQILIMGDDDEAEKIMHEVIQKHITQNSLLMLSFNRINENSEFISAANNINLGTLSFLDFVKGRMDQIIDMMVPGIVFSKEHFNMANGFVDSGLSKHLYSDDLLWYKIAAITNKVTFTNEVTWNYRVHSSQIGHNVNLFEFNNAVPLFINKIITEICTIKKEKNYNIFQEVEIAEQEYIDRLILTRHRITTNKLYSRLKLIKQGSAVLLSPLSLLKKKLFLKTLLKSLIK